MGQARKNKVRPSNDEIEFRPRGEAGLDVGNSNKKQTQNCITFRLEDCTLLAERVQTNDVVFGDFAQPRITIMNDKGVIGHVPAAISKRILARVVGTDGNIHGVVVDYKPPRSVKVEICI